MGQVFLAEDLKLQRRAALKLISPTLTRDETRRQRFVQEARVAASIDHPHIAAIYDIDEVDGRTYIAMEYVEGGSLREVLKAGPLKLRQALDYAGQAADALGKVHARGVVHRDLKPENLLIAKDGYLKIIDFGLAKLMDPVAHSALADAATVADVQVRTAEGVVMGTMGYMSPEQVRGETVDARSDIFSFGAVLYEMVTGVAPFRKRSSADTISAILGEMPAAPRVENVTAGTELQRILRKCLAKDPDSRYQGMRDLVVDLRQLRESITSSETCRGRSSPHANPPPPGGDVQPVWIGAAVLAAAIAAATLWPVRRGGERASHRARRSGGATGRGRRGVRGHRGQPRRGVAGQRPALDADHGTRADTRYRSRGQRTVGRCGPTSRSIHARWGRTLETGRARASCRRPLHSQRHHCAGGRGPSDRCARRGSLDWGRPRWRRPCVGPTRWPWPTTCRPVSGADWT